MVPTKYELVHRLGTFRFSAGNSCRRNRPGTPGKLVSESLSNVFQLAQSALSADIWDTRPHDSGNYKIRCDCSRTFRPLKAVYSTGLSTVKNICFTLTFPRCLCPKQGLACIPTAEAEGFTLGWVSN